MRKIHIKNMVCSRFTEAVESIFKDQEIGIKNIQLWEVIVDELNLSEIAYKLNYSSVAHLSKKFKQLTGMSPSDFKKNQNSLGKELIKFEIIL